MVQQITKGIKISITSNFEERRYQHNKIYYAFSYSITIKNQSSDAVQLLSRHWNIFDSLNNIEIIEGDGVVGEKPVILPKESYTYSSYCLLTSSMGAMDGYYNMINFTSSRQFKVQIPIFQLILPATFN
ncbi:MAG: Co2+/Mg2+ efflux protein ApaG [Flavobacteriaceae bacterium]|nr:Co2+/Mg2+ efflux protein ApaG [Flavobacteriaceae bacterium]